MWYGECGPSDTNPSANYNCKYDGEAVLQKDEKFMSMFKELCPHLYKGPNTTATCCDAEQFYHFNADLSVPKQLMSRCPACFTNFRTFLCDMTCSPNNADFLLITQSRPYHPKSTTAPPSHDDHEEEEENEENEDNESAHEDKNRSGRQRRDVTSQPHRYTSDDPPKPTEEVIRYTYHLTNYYANNLYNSCK